MSDSLPAIRPVTIRPLPFAEPSVVTVAQGLTVAEIVNRQIGEDRLGPLMVEINGIPLAADRWADFVPASSDHVLIFAGVGNDGRGFLRAILSIVVIAAATYVGNVAGGALAAQGVAGAGLIGGVVTGAASAAGLLLLNSFIPPRQITSPTYSDSQAYSIAAGSNRARPFGVIPQVLGRHKVFPDWAAKPYTEIKDNDEYLHMLFCFGFGPLAMDDFKIGDTALSDYNDVQIEVRDGWPTDDPITTFPSAVDQTPVGVDLTAATGWVTRTVDAGFKEISWDIEFPAGLMEIDSRTAERKQTYVTFDIQFRQAGGTWYDFTGPVNYDSALVFDISPGLYSLPQASTVYSLYATPIGEVVAQYGTSEINGYVRIGTITMTRGPSNWAIVSAYENFVLANVTGLTISTDVGQVRVYVAAGTVTFGDVTIAGHTGTALRRTYQLSVDENYGHEVRIKRLTADRDTTYVVDRAQWKHIRGIAKDSPIDEDKCPHKFALLALHIKATGQLSGPIADFSAVCQSICTVWGGSAWSGTAPTSNPAALARHVLTGEANHRPRSAAQIDDAELGALYTAFATAGWAFNQLRDFQASVWDTIADILAAARSAPAHSNGKWSAVRDVSGKSISGHLSPRNSWGFSAHKPFVEHPHAFRVRFRNEDNDWEWDERIVYDDGYDENNATLFEGLTLIGITDPDLIWKHARYYIADQKLRPEEYYCFQDFEHLTVKRGDLVRCVSEVTLWGLGSGMVKSLTTSGANTTGVVLDEAVTMEAGTSYALRFRLADGSSLLVALTTVAGEGASLAFAVAVPTASGPAVGDMAQFGVADYESAPAIVKRIERQGEFVARLTLVDEAADIYDADTGSIPDFDTRVTQPTDITNIAPPAPSIANVESGETALEKIGNTVRPRILVTINQSAGNVPIGRYTIRYRISGDDEWQYQSITPEGRTFVLIDIIELLTYELSVQAVSIYGKASAWSATTEETVVGGTEPPDNVTGFAVNIVGTDAHLSWDPVGNFDMSYYRIRWTPLTSGASWVAGVDIVSKVSHPATSITAPALVGTYMIKAFDIAGNQSVSAAVFITTIAAVAGLNVVETFVRAHPNFAGTGANCEVDNDMGGIVLSDPSVSPTGYYAFSGLVDLQAIFTSRISASMTIGAQDLSFDLYDLDDLYDAENLYGDLDGLYSVALELAATDADSPTTTDQWSAWKPFLVGDYTARAFKFRAKLISSADEVTPIVTTITVTIDMPDRVYGFSAAVGTGGAAVSFDPEFFETPEIGLSVLDGQEGDRYTITNLDETGFDIAFTNSGSPVARNIKGVAKGYGQRSTVSVIVPDGAFLYVDTAGFSHEDTAGIEYVDSY